MPSNIYQPRPSQIRLDAKSGHIGMEDAVYVNTNESLQVTVISSTGANPKSSAPPLQGTQVCIDVRMLTVTNGLQYLTFTLNPTDDYVTNSFVIKLPEGFVLSINAYTMGTWQQTSGDVVVFPMIGQTWVDLSVVVSAEPQQYTGTFLAQGYATNHQRVCYPVPQEDSYQDGYPFVRYIAGPAAQLQYNVPLHAVNEITGVSFAVATSATVGNRQPYIDFRASPNGQVASLRMPFEQTITANFNATYWATMGQPSYQFGTGWFFANLPHRVRLSYGDSVLVQIGFGLGGDTVSAMSVWGNEWLMP